MIITSYRIFNTRRKTQVLSNRRGFLWQQKLNISSLLFRLAWRGWVRIKYFSRVHNSHTPEIGLKGAALPKIFHLKSYSMSLSLRVHMWWLRVVLLLPLWFSKVDSWLLYLNLNWVELNPMQVSFLGGVSSVVTVAWYMVAVSKLELG